jgi:predicted MFS family arabinose efflux permease
VKPVALPTRMALLPAQAGPTLVLVLLAPVVPGIAAHFGKHGALAAQQIVTYPFLGLVVGSLLCGAAIRLLGLRLLMQLSFAGWLVSGLIGIFAESVPALLGGSAILGACAAFFTSCLAAMTAILFDDVNRPRMVGHQSAAAHSIGIGLTIVASLLASSFGWRTPFAAIFVYASIMLAMTTLFLPDIKHQQAIVRMSIREILRRIWPLCLAGFTIFLLTSNETTNLPFLLDQGGLTTAGLRSLVTISTPGAGILGAIIFSKYQAKWSARRLILLGGICHAGGWLVFWLWSGGLPIAMLAAGLIGVGMGIFMPMIFSRLMQVAPGEQTGTALGLLNVAIFAGSFSNPSIMAPLRNVAGLHGMMLGIAACVLVAALIAMVAVSLASQSADRSPGSGRKL